MDIKSLVNSIIDDLLSGKPIADIMLKVKGLDHYLSNPDFHVWVSQEMNGYKDKNSVPDYRIVSTALMVDISLPYRGVVSNYSLPADIIQDKTIRELTKTANITESIFEIEAMADNEDSTLYIQLPAYAYVEIGKCLSGNLVGARQVLSLPSVKAITQQVKSLLLDFLMNMIDQTDWNIDFNTEKNKEIRSVIINQTIHNQSGVVHTGTGNVSLEDTNCGMSLAITEIYDEKLAEVLARVEDLLSRCDNETQQSVNETIRDVRDEVERGESKSKVVRNCLKFLKKVADSMGEALIAASISQLLQNI